MVLRFDRPGRDDVPAVADQPPFLAHRRPDRGARQRKLRRDVLRRSRAGGIADRFGRRRVFKYSIIGWGWRASDWHWHGTSRPCSPSGSCSASAWAQSSPVAAAILAEFMPSSKRGRYAALLEGAWPIGFITAGAVSYLLVASTFGWRGFFLMQAALAVVALIIRRNPAGVTAVAGLTGTRGSQRNAP
ncbi:MFS transporter [Rhodococcus opacus]|nr:MFS transporter [Rhodococcus opacus]